MPQPDSLDELPEQVAALMSDLGRLKRHADHLARCWHTTEEPQTEVAGLVTATLAQMQNVVELVVPFMARQLRLECALDRLAGAPVMKRLPAWALRQTPETQRWLTQLPQDVLDSPYLERSFQAMAAGGMMANRDTLEVLKGRVREHERHAAAATAEPALDGVSTWQGEQTMEPFACPRCGSVGSGKGMAEHLANEHNIGVSVA